MKRIGKMEMMNRKYRLTVRGAGFGHRAKGATERTPSEEDRQLRPSGTGLCPPACARVRLPGPVQLLRGLRGTAPGLPAAPPVRVRGAVYRAFRHRQGHPRQRACDDIAAIPAYSTAKFTLIPRWKLTTLDQDTSPPGKRSTGVAAIALTNQSSPSRMALIAA